MSYVQYAPQSHQSSEIITFARISMSLFHSREIIPQHGRMHANELNRRKKIFPFAHRDTKMRKKEMTKR